MALSVFENGRTEYVILRNDMAGRYVCEAALKLKNAFASACGVEMPIKTDIYQHVGDIPENTPEILVGGTNRPESSGANCPVSMGEHAICVLGNRVVIKGGNDAGTVEAVDVFIRLFLQPGTTSLILDDGYAYKGHTTYRIDPDSEDDFDPNSYLIRRLGNALVFVAGYPYAIMEGQPVPLDPASNRAVACLVEGRFTVPAVFCRRQLGLSLEDVCEAVAVEDVAGALGKHCFVEEAYGFCLIGDEQTPYDRETEATLIEDTAELIKGLPYAVADVELTGEGLETTVGLPCILPPDGIFPTVRVSACFDLQNIRVHVLLDGKPIAEQTPVSLTCGEEKMLVFDDLSLVVGDYRVHVSLTCDGVEYEYDRFVTVLDTTRFEGDGETPLAFLENGKMRYVCDVYGNRLCDFSLCGYENGADLPDPATIPALVKLSPCDGDDGLAIQAAIDYVSKFPMRDNHYRGAVELAPGRYNCKTSFNIHTSGIVLRGTGAAPGDTVLVGEMGQRFASLGGVMHLQPRRRPPENGGDAPRRPEPPRMPPPDRKIEEGVSVLGTYLPAGSKTLRVADPSRFAVGDDVVLIKTVRYSWIKQMGMSELFRNGTHQTWLAEGAQIYTERVVCAIDGDVITLDAPITDSFDAAYLGFPLAKLAKYTFPERTHHTGFENFTLEKGSLIVDRTVDSFVRGVQILGNTGNSFVAGSLSKRITCRDMNIDHETLTVRAAPADYMVTGQYMLMENCRAPLEGGSWAFVLQARGAGLSVIRNSVGAVCPHARWSVGLLVECCDIAKAQPNRHGISFINRHIMGSGHGWTVGWSVAWNVNTPYFKNEAAPGTANYCIGCRGEIIPATYRSGQYLSHGTPVAPYSLYEAQCAMRHSCENQ